MTETLSLISILSTIELKLNGALAVSKNPKSFNHQISELDKFFSFPSALLQLIELFSGLIIAIPAESYPLYSSFSNPFINNGKAIL